MWLRNRQRTVTAAPQIVRTARVERQSIDLTVASSGNVAVHQKLDLSFRTPGTVFAVEVEVGDRVQAGQRLASLDRTAAIEALQQAQIAVTQAELDLKRFQRPADRGDIALAELSIREGALAMSVAKISEQVAQTQAYLDQTRAQDAAERTNDAYESVVDRLDSFGLPEAYAAPVTAAKMEAEGNVGITQLRSEQAIQRAQSNWQTAYERYERASQTLETLQEGADQDQVRSLELALELAQLGVEQAQANLDALVLTSPIDGVVAAVYLQVGDLSGTGVPAITVLDDSTLYVDLSVDEIDIGAVDAGQAVRIGLDAYADVEMDGTVESIAMVPQTATGVSVYPVRARLDTLGPRAVREGMTASGSIVVSVVEDVLVAPTWAIRTDTSSGERYTYRVAGETVERVAVETGISNETWTEIASGLDEGATVALVAESRSLFDLQPHSP